MVFHLRGPDPDGGRPPGCRRSARCRRILVRGHQRPDRARPAVLHRRRRVGRRVGARQARRRNGNTLESHNAFVYRFEGDRIAEMWMFLGAPRGGRGVLLLTALEHVEQDWTRGASHRGRSGGERSPRWGDAWRQCPTFAPDSLDVDDLDRAATAAYLTGHDEEGFARWVRAHQVCAGRRRPPPGGALRGEARSGLRVQR